MANREIAKASDDRTFEKPGEFHLGLIEAFRELGKGLANECRIDRAAALDISSKSPALARLLAFDAPSPYDKA